MDMKCSVWLLLFLCSSSSWAVERYKVVPCEIFLERFVRTICREFAGIKERQACMDCFQQIGTKQTIEGIEKCKQYLPENLMICGDYMGVTNTWTIDDMYEIVRLFYRVMGDAGEPCAILNGFPIEIAVPALKNMVAEFKKRFETDKYLNEHAITIASHLFKIYNVIKPMDDFIETDKYNMIDRVCHLPTEFDADASFEEVCKQCVLAVLKMDPEGETITFPGDVL